MEGVCTWAGWARKRTQGYFSLTLPFCKKGYTKGTTKSEAVLFAYNGEMGTELSLDSFGRHLLSTSYKAMMGGSGRSTCERDSERRSWVRLEVAMDLSFVSSSNNTCSYTGILLPK